MEDQDFPLRHFEEMAGLAKSLSELPAQVQDHQYSYESFGSWAVIVRFKGVRLRISFDGRDSAYSIERSESRKAPDKWGAARWLEITSNETFPLPAIVAAVADSTV